MKKSYSKSSLIRKRIFLTIIILLIMLIVSSTIFLVTIGLKNYITFEKIDTSAKDAPEDAAKNANAIIINNVVIGAMYNFSFVGSEKFYMNQSQKSDLNIDIDAYTINGKKGQYKLNSYTNNSGTIYATTSVPDMGEEYICVTSGGNDIMPNPAIRKQSVTEEDIKVVKKALGIKKIFNSTIRIDSIYSISINSNIKGRIYSVTNEVGKSFGGYSAIIYEDISGKTQIIKYSYVRNLKNSSEWPLYSFKFIADLNKDGNNEIILQETKEFEVVYDVIEYRDNKFYQVLSSKIK